MAHRAVNREITLILEATDQGFALFREPLKHLPGSLNGPFAFLQHDRQAVQQRYGIQEGEVEERLLDERVELNCPGEAAY